jgi:hypothetical protein
VCIADTFDFFFRGLTGGMDVVLDTNFLFIAADVPPINILLMEEARLGLGEGTCGDGWVDDPGSHECVKDNSPMERGTGEDGHDTSELDAPPLLGR